MKKIGILIDCRIDVKNINVIENGNPGIGGSEYQLLQLFYYLNKDGEYNCKLYVIENGGTIADDNAVCLKSDEDAIKKAAEDKIDIFVFIPKNKRENFYEDLLNFNLKSVAWVHNYISYNVMKLLSDCKVVKRVIFVGNQHYDHYIDDRLINKSDYIYNMLSFTTHNFISPAEKEPIVTFIGALIPTKGFHKLAKIWKKVLKKVPAAKLQVIGDGKLYDRNAVLGKFSIAESKYEKKILKHLSDKNGEILNSVTFYGSLGIEKDKLIEKTKVGVANPTGKSETFCLSAVEYKTYGIPIVSYRGFGILDTVRNGIDGILIKSSKELENAIVKLLTDNRKNYEYGRNGLADGLTDFLPNKIILQWKKVFHDIHCETAVQIKQPTNHFSDDFKWLKIINFHFKRILHIKCNSIAYTVSYSKEIVKKFLKKY